MDITRGMVLLLALVVGLALVAPADARFIGTGLTLNKQLGDTININVGANALAADSAFGIADMNMAIDWGVGYDLNTIAGYPYGFGGIGAVTTGDIGFNLGLSMDETHGAGFNGAEWGIPITQQGLTTTHFNQEWANINNINSVNAILPFSGFPVL